MANAEKGKENKLNTYLILKKILTMYNYHTIYECNVRMYFQFNKNCGEK